jgi:hypothetical protein
LIKWHLLEAEENHLSTGPNGNQKHESF